MKRLLLTIPGKRCPFACHYCFARFTQYRNSLTLDRLRENPRLLKNVDFVYPACDTDLFAYPEALDHLWEIEALGRSICVSTKAPISTGTADELAELNKSLNAKGRFIKIGLSFATKRHVPTIEPRTSTYEARLEALGELSQRNVPTSVILKPLLTEIPTQEYLEILEDTGRITRAFVVGDEYLDIKSLEGARTGSSRIERRRVAWAHGEPIWPVRIASEHTKQIQAFLEKHGLACYHSDLDLMVALQRQFSRHNLDEDRLSPVCSQSASEKHAVAC